jgi:uncharacterized protein (UPF0147 family)
MSYTERELREEISGLKEAIGRLKDQLFELSHKYIRCQSCIHMMDSISAHSNDPESPCYRCIGKFMDRHRCR